MPDPLVAEMHQRWKGYCANSASAASSEFTFLFSESAVGQGRPTRTELEQLLAPFPKTETLVTTIAACIDRRWDGPISCEDQELIDLAEADLKTIRRLANEEQLSVASQELAGPSTARLVDPLELNQDPFVEQPADFLDSHWDGILGQFQDLAGDLTGLYGLREACWGLAVNRYVVFAILQPLVPNDLGLRTQLELWLRGAETRFGNGELLVARTM